MHVVVRRMQIFEKKISKGPKGNGEEWGLTIHFSQDISDACIILFSIF